MVLSCVLCGGPSLKVRDWTRDDIRRAYAKLSAEPFPVENVDYQIFRCESCELVFADAPVPGSDAFYAWATTIPNYYRSDRWEWDRAVEMVNAAGSVLEIGCGTGNFLARVSHGREAVGLDTNPTSIAECRRRGLDAHCLTLEQYAATHPEARFDAVCTFHCLEHVAAPLALAETMKALLSPGGQIIVSVPYSPTSWEALEWGCLNLPPHHLTRWNRHSLARLAMILGVGCEFETEPAEPRSLRAAYWRFTSLTGSSSPLAQPIKFLRVARFMARREPVGDTALAIFRGPHVPGRSTFKPRYFAEA